MAENHSNKPCATETVAERDPRYPQLTEVEQRAIVARIESVAMSLLSIHDVCPSLIELAGPKAAAAAIIKLIQETARAGVKGMDACIQKMETGPALGNFADELELDRFKEDGAAESLT